MITSIYLMRHGETLWNRAGRIQGQKDVRLSLEGRRQAHRAGEHLFAQLQGRLDVIYTSDLARARETAEIISTFFNLSPRTEKRLREINFGPWEGLTWTEIGAHFPQEWEIWLKQPTALQLQAAETLEEVYERAAECLDEIVSEHPGRRILVVSHGVVIRTLLCGFTGIHLDRWREIKQGNTAINHLQFDGRNYQLITCNNLEHLA